MKILYAIQGTGNGHITVAREVLPILKKRAEVDILVSGDQADVGLHYEIKYKLHGLSFMFGQNGGIDYLETFRKSNIKQIFKDIKDLPVENYDLVISDFEPISGWACYFKNKPCIGFSHQAAVINNNSPKPNKNDFLGRIVLKYYAPASYHYGFHYESYDKNIFTPIIRKEIREQEVKNNGHYTVYLPSYSDKRILKLLSYFPEIKWEVFSKHCIESYQTEHILVCPIHNEQFIQSMVSAEGVLCNSGFQTPAETIFLKKKLMVIPMKGQYEQQCNAAALKLLGVPVIKNIKLKQLSKVEAWIKKDTKLKMDFPNETEIIVDEILKKQYLSKHEAKLQETPIQSSTKFRDYLLKKIFYQPGS